MGSMLEYARLVDTALRCDMNSKGRLFGVAAVAPCSSLLRGLRPLHWYPLYLAPMNSLRSMPCPRSNGSRSWTIPPTIPSPDTTRAARTAPAEAPWWNNRPYSMTSVTFSIGWLPGDNALRQSQCPADQPRPLMESILCHNSSRLWRAVRLPFPYHNSSCGGASAAILYRWPRCCRERSHGWLPPSFASEEVRILRPPLLSNPLLPGNRRPSAR